MITKQGAIAVFLILAWLAPTVSALGIHAHVHLEHSHGAGASAGLALETEGHGHEVPELDVDQAPLVRVGKQKLHAVAPLPVAVSRVATRAGLSMGPLAAPDFESSREGPPLQIRHCSFLI